VTEPAHDDAPATRRGRGRRTPSTTEGTARAVTSIAPASSAMVITEPCVVDDMPDEVYHRDPVPSGSLSHSGMKTILDVPARFAYERKHGRKPKAEFDLGHAAHAEALGVGMPLAILPAEYTAWTTNYAKQFRREARERGDVPILATQWGQVRAMAAVLREHHTAGKLFVPGRGHAEQSGFWYDDQFGVWRRVRFDWITTLADGRVVIVDYKSSASKVSPANISKRLHDFGYFTQDEYYRQGAHALDLAPDGATFLFVFQEVDPPYLVTVVECNAEAREWARLQIAHGLDLYARCKAADHWPDYAPNGPISLGIPQWAERRFEEEWRARAFEIVGTL
jgi:hypothetical protein